MIKSAKTNNVIISPISIQSATTMLMYGASGETRTEMTNAMRYKGIDYATISSGIRTLVSTTKNSKGVAVGKKLN